MLWALQSAKVTHTSATILKRVFLRHRGAMGTHIVLTEATKFPDVTPVSTSTNT